MTLKRILYPAHYWYLQRCKRFPRFSVYLMNSYLCLYFHCKLPSIGKSERIVNILQTKMRNEGLMPGKNDMLEVGIILINVNTQLSDCVWFCILNELINLRASGLINIQKRSFSDLIEWMTTLIVVFYLCFWHFFHTFWFGRKNKINYPFKKDGKVYSQIPKAVGALRNNKNNKSVQNGSFYAEIITFVIQLK